MRMLKLLSLCLILLATAPVHAELTFYVAPDGSDTASGSVDSPFVSMEQARDTIRRLDGQQRQQNIRVILRGGTYPIRDTFVLGVQDSPPLGFKVSYEAFPGETPVLDSGVAITGWRPVTEPPEGTPVEAKAHLWEADLPEGLTRFYSLFDEQGFLPRARVAFETDPLLPRAIDGIRSRWLERDLLRYKSGPFRQWHNIGDVEIYKKPTRNWVANFLQLESVDLDAGIARTSVEGTYKLSDNPPKKRRTTDAELIEVDQTGELCNVPEGLTKPGNWIVDTVRRKVYLWPNGEKPQGRIVAPSLREYICIDGRNDEWGDDDLPVRDITVKGLTFKHGKRLVLRKDSRGIQHDWEMFDEPDALIRLRGAERCEIRDCQFVNSAGTAIRLDLYCQNNTVAGNVINNIGYTGILLCGYGPGTKDVNRSNLITNNEISRVGQLWFHGLGIFVFQSGHNLISHNYIHDTLYDAIVVSGVRPRFFGYPFNDFPNFPEAFPDLREIMRIMRWDEMGGKPATFKGCLDYAHSRGNVMEFNEMDAAMMEGGDGNALYLSGTMGNTYRYNLVHSSPTGPGMLRTDDEQYEATCYGNILIGRPGTTSGVILKHENTFENNIVINWDEAAIGRADGSTVNRNIFLHLGEQAEFYKQPELLRGDHNLFYTSGNVAGAEAWLKTRKQSGQDANSRVADPMFRDLEHLDFGHEPNSPAMDLGFQPIPFERIGLLDRPAIRRLREEGVTITSLTEGR